MALLILLHVIGASVWLGGHLILLLGFVPRALRQNDPEIIRKFEEVYERIGIPALLLQIVTGVWMSEKYLGNLTDAFLFQSPMERYIAWKIILIAVTVILALHARLRIIPKLQSSNLRYLVVHITGITVIALFMAFLGTGIRVGEW